MLRSVFNSPRRNNMSMIEFAANFNVTVLKVPSIQENLKKRVSNKFLSVRGISHLSVSETRVRHKIRCKNVPYDFEEIISKKY